MKSTSWLVSWFAAVVLLLLVNVPAYATDPKQIVVNAVSSQDGLPVLAEELGCYTQGGETKSCTSCSEITCEFGGTPNYISATYFASDDSQQYDTFSASPEGYEVIGESPTQVDIDWAPPYTGEEFYQVTFYFDIPGEGSGPDLPRAQVVVLDEHGDPFYSDLACITMHAESATVVPLCTNCYTGICEGDGGGEGYGIGWMPYAFGDGINPSPPGGQNAFASGYRFYAWEVSSWSGTHVITATRYETAPPTPTPTLTPTPGPTPTPTPDGWVPDPDDLYDLFDLPGDYGVLGRVFDFRVIFTIIFGFLDIFGVANIRDFAAIGAAIAIIVTVMFNPE